MSQRYLQRCLVCNEEVPWDTRQLWTEQGIICMGCEFSEIDVWHVTLPGEPKNGYYDIEIGNINDMLKECDYGDGYTIVKEKMKAVKYYSLPEFTGF